MEVLMQFEHSRGEPGMPEFLRRPSALIPIAMSATALSLVIGYVMTFGTARQADEGAAAHMWQLLMVGQLPVIAVFAVKWLPAAPRQALPILAIQLGAALIAILPVWLLHW